MTDVPQPELGHNDIMIKIRKTAICTDVRISTTGTSGRKNIPVPMVVGHEYVGEVVAIGQEVKVSALAIACPAKAISPVATVATAAAAARTCAATPSAWA